MSSVRPLCWASQNQEATARAKEISSARSASARAASQNASTTPRSASRGRGSCRTDASTLRTTVRTSFSTGPLPRPGRDRQAVGDRAGVLGLERLGPGAGGRREARGVRRGGHLGDPGPDLARDPGGGEQCGVLHQGRAGHSLEQQRPLLAVLAQQIDDAVAGERRERGDLECGVRERGDELQRVRCSVGRAHGEHNAGAPAPEVPVGREVPALQHAGGLLGGGVQPGARRAVLVEEAPPEGAGELEESGHLDIIAGSVRVGRRDGSNRPARLVR